MHLLVRSGDVGLTGNIYVGLMEFAEMALVAHVLREDDTFLDVGANAGAYAVLAAGWCGARVIAIEPVPESFAKLEANIGSNNLSERVELHCTAVGACEGSVAFTNNLDAMNHVVSNSPTSDASTIEVSLRSLDALLGGRSPSVIKLDVEGYEREVIAGAVGTLGRPDVKVLIVEIFTESSAPDGGKTTLELLRAYGFEPFRYLPRQRELLANPTPASGNVILIRDLAWAQERIGAAAPIRIFGEAI